MAYTTNTLTNIAPILLKEGLASLRENAVMASLCGYDVKAEAAQKNATISVVLPYAVPAQEVVVATQTTATPLIPTTVDITLANWWEASFSLSDKDMAELRPGFLPMAAAEAIKSLANKVDISLLNLYKDIYGAVGTYNATPDGLDDLANCRKMLNKQLAPLNDRVMIISPEAEAGFLGVDQFIGADKTGGTQALRDASLGRLFGFDIYMDQNVPNHTKGTLVSSVPDCAVKDIVAAGLKAAVLNNSSGTGTLAGTLVAGDIITFANQTQQYVITALATAGSQECAITFEPALKTALADGTLVTIQGSCSQNLAFQKGAFCFASRPLASLVDSGLGSIISSDIDPVSGLSLRLEISRYNRQTRFSYDILWGVKTIRREYATRLIGTTV